MKGDFLNRNDLWVKDLSTEKEICATTDLYKDAVKYIKKKEV